MSLEKNWPIFLLVWAGLLIGFFYLVLIPGGEKLESLREEKGNLQTQVLTLERKVRNLEVLEKRLTELRATASLLEERLPEEKEISNLLLVIEDSALRSGVEIQSLQPQASATQKEEKNSDKSQPAYLEAPFESKLMSDYHGFLLFLNYLRKSPRLIQVKDFDLEEDKNGNLLIAMGLSTYVFSKGETK
ncbi:MAG: type pilus assembly protein PilO [Candidatus Atribacteria bacterium]|nr:type pilus assembly protein PilO [Candidatus Atribacteria bacterium]